MVSSLLHSLVVIRIIQDIVVIVIIVLVVIVGLVVVVVGDVRGAVAGPELHPGDL